jgi:hypothetical protein
MAGRIRLGVVYISPAKSVTRGIPRGTNQEIAPLVTVEISNGIPHTDWEKI